MKGLVAAIAAVVALMGVGGAAYGQYDYGSMVPGYGYSGQDYGQGYGQYGQTLPDYSQYAQGQGELRTAVSAISTGAARCGNYPGYGGYQGYGGYGILRSIIIIRVTGQGEAPRTLRYQQQQTPQRRGARQPAQYQAARPQQQQACYN